MDEKRRLSVTTKTNMKLEKVEDQNLFKKMAHMINDMAKKTGSLVLDFFDDEHKRRKQANRQNMPAPSLIKSVDDLARLTHLYLHLVDQAQQASIKLSQEQLKGNQLYGGVRCRR